MRSFRPKPQTSRSFHQVTSQAQLWARCERRSQRTRLHHAETQIRTFSVLQSQSIGKREKTKRSLALPATQTQRSAHVSSGRSGSALHATTPATAGPSNQNLSHHAPVSGSLYVRKMPILLGSELDVIAHRAAGLTSTCACEVKQNDYQQ